MEASTVHLQHATSKPTCCMCILVSCDTSLLEISVMNVLVAPRSAPGKLPEWQVWFWGSNSWSDPKGDTPSNVLTLARKRVWQVARFSD